MKLWQKILIGVAILVSLGVAVVVGLAVFAVTSVSIKCDQRTNELQAVARAVSDETGTPKVFGVEPKVEVGPNGDCLTGSAGGVYLEYTLSESRTFSEINTELTKVLPLDVPYEQLNWEFDTDMRKVEEHRFGDKYVYINYQYSDDPAQYPAEFENRLFDKIFININRLHK